MVEKMEVAPLQVDANKCAFGHFYNAINIEDEAIKDIWISIDSIHHDFHDLGDRALDGVEDKDYEVANDSYKEADDLSQVLLGKMDQVLKEL